MICVISTKTIKAMKCKLLSHEEENLKCVFQKDNSDIGLDEKLIFTFMDEFEKTELFIDFSIYLRACRTLNLNIEKESFVECERDLIDIELKRFCSEEIFSCVRMFSDTERRMLLKH